jgi:DNA polymerase-3 subunit gamma/tau
LPAQSGGTAPAALQADLADLWARLVEAVGRASPFTRTYLLEAHPVSFQKNVFTIGFDPEFEDHLGLVDNARNHTLLQTKLLELGHPSAQIKFVKAPAPERSAVAPAEPAAPPTPAPAPNTPPRPIAAAKPAPAAPVATKEKLAPVPFSKDDFKNDPLIQKALEIFKGQIVEVRA